MDQKKLERLEKRDKMNAYITKIIMPVLIATAALAVSLFVMQFAGGYYKKMMNREKPSIKIDEQGLVYLDLKNITGDLLVLWEVDGGALSYDGENPLFEEQSALKEAEQGSVEQNTIPIQHNYLLYTDASAHINWSLEETQRGETFEEATIVATIYYKTEGESNYYIESGNLLTMMTATVKMENGMLVKEENPRYFGNPKKADGAADWCEIYPVMKDADKCIYRLRHGYDLSKYTQNEIAQSKITFESNVPILYETDLMTGAYLSNALVAKQEADQSLNAQAVTILSRDLDGTTSLSGKIEFSGTKPFVIEDQIVIVKE